MVVATDPRTNDRRRFKEAAIRVVDMLAYLAVFVGGIGAVLVTPDTVKHALAGLPWLVVVWATLLLAGGLLGFVGRLSRIWVIEIPGASAGFFGAAMYFVILGTAAISAATAVVATTLVATMMLLMARRYLELQILTSEPTSLTFIEKFRAILRRRTTDTVSRHH